jgi:hypothetical protein
MLAARVEQKNGNYVCPLDNKSPIQAPYKPDAGNLHVRFDERDVETGSRVNH